MSLPFYMDHHVHAAITTGLRGRKIDVITAWDDGFSRKSDEELLLRATELERCLLTFDSDLLVLCSIWLGRGQMFSGVVFGRSRNMTISEMINDLELIALSLTREEVRNTVVWIPV